MRGGGKAAGGGKSRRAVGTPVSRPCPLPLALLFSLSAWCQHILETLKILHSSGLRFPMMTNRTVPWAAASHLSLSWG